MNTNAIEVRKLTHSFSGTPVLRDISFSIARGELVSIIGPSGCGKTVLLKLLSGLLSADSGDFNLGTKTSDISVAFQDAPLFPWMTIRENLRVCMEHRYGSAALATQSVNSLLKTADLERFDQYYPKELSGGMQQKVNILRAFSTDTNVILMDEPFVHLDYLQRHSLQDFTRDTWERQKRTILFVTHDIDEALYLSDRVLVFSKSPGTLIRELTIPMPRPRQRLAIRSSSVYTNLFKEISELLATA